MTIEDTLLQRFGPLLSMAQLATVLDRSPDGLRISLRATNQWTRRINKGPFEDRPAGLRTSQIADVLSDESLYETGTEEWRLMYWRHSSKSRRSWISYGRLPCRDCRRARRSRSHG